MDKTSLHEMRKLAGLIPTSPGFPDDEIDETSDAAYEKEKRQKTDAAIQAAARAIWKELNPGGKPTGSAFQGLIHTIEMTMEKHLHDIIDGLDSEGGPVKPAKLPPLAPLDDIRILQLVLANVHSDRPLKAGSVTAYNSQRETMGGWEGFFLVGNEEVSTAEEAAKLFIKKVGRQAAFKASQSRYESMRQSGLL